MTIGGALKAAPYENAMPKTSNINLAGGQEGETILMPPPPFVHSFVTPASLLSPFPASLLQLPHLTNFQKLDLKFNTKFDLQKNG